MTHSPRDTSRRQAAHTGPSSSVPQQLPPRPIPAPSALARTRFLQLSEALTGFDDAELNGTGMVESYLGALMSIVGEDMTARLLQTWADLVEEAEEKPERVEALLVHLMASDATLGPLVRNLAFLWYTGQWNQMPADWRDAHGASALDQTSILSPESYTEGLVWKAIFTHPQGAKQPGYGSWALPPKGATP